MNGEDKELQKSNEPKSLLEPPGDDEDVAACIYTDWSNSPPSTSDEDAIRREELSHPANRKLPTKLNAMLSDPIMTEIIAWLPHGRSWRILNRDQFDRVAVPMYFEHTTLTSFLRLVNAWGFRRIMSGIDTESYFHELFLRGMPHLHTRMKRLAPNDRKNQAWDRDRLPNFYAIPLPYDNYRYHDARENRDLSSSSFNSLTENDNAYSLNDDVQDSPNRHEAAYQPGVLNAFPFGLHNNRNRNPLDTTQLLVCARQIVSRYDAASRQRCAATTDRRRQDSAINDQTQQSQNFQQGLRRQQHQNSTTGTIFHPQRVYPANLFMFPYYHTVTNNRTNQGISFFQNLLQQERHGSAPVPPRASHVQPIVAYLTNVLRPRVNMMGVPRTNEELVNMLLEEWIATFTHHSSQGSPR